MANSNVITALRKEAAKWRESNSEHQGGVVLIWNSVAYGWKDRLRDPQTEMPGSYAVDGDGHVFIAEGGDDYNGAKVWSVAPHDGV